MWQKAKLMPLFARKSLILFLKNGKIIVCIFYEKRVLNMKARIPKHREFIINLNEETEERANECWAKLQEIMDAYQKEGKSVYTSTFIEDNEEKVKALQKDYKFTYTIELK